MKKKRNMFRRFREIITDLRRAHAAALGEAAGQRMNAERQKARVTSLEERLNLYADSRATHELMRDSMELCIRVDLPTYKARPHILDDVLARLRSDFVQKAHRR